MSEKEKSVLETFKKGYGLTKAETEIILNLIEKQQKEIEELKEKSKKCEYYEMVADDLYKNSINKDKINAKIKEYQNKLFQDIEENKVVEYENIIQVLEELLEE